MGFYPQSVVGDRNLCRAHAGDRRHLNPIQSNPPAPSRKRKKSLDLDSDQTLDRDANKRVAENKKKIPLEKSGGVSPASVDTLDFHKFCNFFNSFSLV